MMIDRLAGNAALKDSVRLMLGSSRLTHSVLLVGETGLGAGYAFAAPNETLAESLPFTPKITLEVKRGPGGGGCG